MKTLLKVLLAAGVASMLLAQNDQVLRVQKLYPTAADARKLDLQTFEFVSGQLISGPPVKGAPYSAEAVNETIQTLADGNRIVQRSSAMQYRDTEGRERREETSAMGAIFISDPVAGTRYTLHPDSQTAEKGPMAAALNLTTIPGGFGVRLQIAAPEGGRGPVTITAGERGAGGGRGTPSSGNAKTEQLGNTYIEGVQAQGTRTTTTIPAGDIGNERPINIVDEQWYSPDLKMTVMTKHSDPRSGDTSFALKNINRSAPPPNLFEVPSDYTVTGGGGGRGGRGAALPADAVQKLQELQKALEQQQRK